MYSLYRAWLSLGACGVFPTSVPTLQSALPAGPAAFGAAATSSGAPDVTLQVGPTMTQFSAHKNVLSAHSGFFKAAFMGHEGLGPIPVPNVNVDEFSSLLTFMYTGYLDLNMSNIYNILLATHILHMPGALEICRSFLIQNHPLERRNNIIKPIPSRKAYFPDQQIPVPLFGTLNKSETTPFRPLIEEKTEQTRTVTAQAQCSEKLPLLQDTPATSVKKGSGEKFRSHKKRQEHSQSDKVIIDVACCDGPVRFHRVLNRNYGITTVPESDTRALHVDRADLMNRVMNENIKDKQRSDENHQNSSDLFTCVYCNHTFKSQYCYQKHARRHLNPVNVEGKSTQKVETVTSSKREVKLLDMNVQYYPCKTCGSKFPSYYFVHKHRKLCHNEEVADGKSAMETNDNEAVTTTSGNHSPKNSSSDDIDVEVTDD